MDIVYSLDTVFYHLLAAGGLAQNHRYVVGVVEKCHIADVFATFDGVLVFGRKYLRVKQVGYRLVGRQTEHCAAMVVDIRAIAGSVIYHDCRRNGFGEPFTSVAVEVEIVFVRKIYRGAYFPCFVSDEMEDEYHRKRKQREDG